MEIGFMVKWTRDKSGFQGQTFKINRFEFRNMKLMAICKLEYGGVPIVIQTHPNGPTVSEAVDYVFEVDELETVTQK